MAHIETKRPELEIVHSRNFTSWMRGLNLSLAFTTYQAGKLFLLGSQDNGVLSVFERSFERCMGLCVSESSLYMSSLYQIWRFENALEEGHTYQDYDRLYVPQFAYTTGDLDIHDMGIGGNGKPVFINTLFSCIATVSEKFSFKPIWQPPFISRLAAEDRCHLNGLAMDGGEPAYVTCAGSSDVADGWRDERQHGGILIDVHTNDIVCEGLSMPHSPRLHRGKLWLLNAGTGYFGFVDLERGSFEPVAFCPGFLRGLCFAENFAIVGLSLPRDDATFSDLALSKNLQSKSAQARCAIHVIDLNTGDTVHFIRIGDTVQELYDVATLRGAQRPMALGFKTDEIQRMVTVESQ